MKNDGNSNYILTCDCYCGCKKTTTVYTTFKTSEVIIKCYNVECNDCEMGLHCDSEVARLEKPSVKTE